MDVSIVIVTYNTLKMTQKCIDSIFEKTYGVKFEIILVDNSSKDGSFEHFSKDNRIKYIYSNENLGFGKGNNIGTSQAIGKYIFYLNSDTLLLNNAVKEFYDWMEVQPERIGCCGCVLIDYYDRPTGSFFDMQSVGYFTTRILEWYHIRIPKKYSGDTLLKISYPKKVDVVTGADMFVRRRCLDVCGVFDPDFFMYYEETELQYRFHKKGYECWVINTPKIKHLVGASANKNTNSQRYLIGQLNSRYVYLKKTHSMLGRLIVYALHLLYLPLLPFKRALPGERRIILKIILSPILK